MNLFEKFKNRLNILSSSPDLSREFTSTSRINKRVYQILNTNIKTLNTYYKYYNDIYNNIGTDHHQKYKVCRDLRVYSDDKTDSEISIRANMLLKIGTVFPDQSSFLKTLFIFTLGLRSNYNLLSGSQYLIDSLPDKVLNNFDEYLRILLTSDNISLSNPSYGVFVFYSDPQLLDLYLDIYNSDEMEFNEFMKNEIDNQYEIVKKRISSLQSSAIKIEALLFSLFRVVLELDSTTLIYEELVDQFMNLVSDKLRVLDSDNFTRILSYQPGELQVFKDFLISFDVNEREEFVKCIKLNVTPQVAAVASDVEEETIVELEEIDTVVHEGHNVTTTTSSRRGQNRFKRFLIKKSQIDGVCKCAIPGCNIIGEQYLIASHILPWQKSTAQEKVDPNNGLLLCPNHDLLFDIRAFSFDSDGRIMISDKLNDQNIKAFGLNRDIVLDLSEQKSKYMSKHKNAMINGKWE